MTRITPRIRELIDMPSTVLTGRLHSYLFNENQKTAAPACQMRLYRNDLAKEMAAISHYTRKGAGVKMPLDKFIARKPLNGFTWHFRVNPAHPDFNKMPVSCKAKYLDLDDIGGNRFDYFTIIPVADSMESIEASWGKFIEAAERGSNIVMELSALRPAGRNVKTGTLSTGIFGNNDTDEGFLSVYYWLAEHLNDGGIGSLIKLLGGLCKVIARGGTHKNGIVTTSLDYRHPDILEYLNYPQSEIAGGSKKSIRFDKGILDNPELVDLVIDKNNNESLMLEKITDPNLYLNVCMGIVLSDLGSCLTSPFNVSKCKHPSDIPAAMAAETELLCLLHEQWREATNADPSLYLPLDKDKQVAVTWLGFANFLRQQGVSYETMVSYMRKYRLYRQGVIGGFSLTADNDEENNALAIAASLWLAYEKSAEIAKGFGLDRAFAVEPTQRCYTDNQDIDGFTTCRGINPPYSQFQTRASEVHGDKTYYHGEVQTIAEVGHQTLQDLAEELQYIMDSTGMAHGQSFDLHRKIDVPWFADFTVRSPLKGTYYQQSYQVEQTYLNKGRVLIASDEECQVCGN